MRRGKRMWHFVSADSKRTRSRMLSLTNQNFKEAKRFLTSLHVCLNANMCHNNTTFRTSKERLNWAFLPFHKLSLLQKLLIITLWVQLRRLPIRLQH